MSNIPMQTLEDVLNKQFPIQEIRLSSKRTNTHFLPDDVRGNMDKEKMPITKGGKIKLYLPAVGAAMDTVTAGIDVRPKYNGGINCDALIILAQEGAIGTAPRSADINLKVQEEIIKKVKRATSFILRGPYTVKPEDTLELAQRYQKNFGYSGYPVVDVRGAVVGILTKRDFENRDPQLLVKDRMTKKVRTVLEEEVTSLAEADTVLDKYRHSRLPVVNKRGRLIGLLTRDDVDNRRFNPHATTDELGRYMVLVAIGTNKDDEELKRLKDADGYVIDASIGRHNFVYEKAEWLKKKTDKPVIVGNAMGYHDAKSLAEVADAVKVGYGIGAGCISSEVTGLGASVANSIFEAYYATIDSNVPVWGDGGMKNSGDLVVGYALGASAIMLGKTIAMGEETPVVNYRNIRGYPEKIYRGMGSEAVRGGRDYKKVAEGTEVWIRLKGPLKEILDDIENGVMAGTSGLGFSSIQELRRNQDLIFNWEPTHLSGAKNIDDLRTIPRNLNI